MKKALLTAAFAVMLIVACGKKENTEASESGSEPQTAVVKDTLTDVDRLEGKVVMSETGEWFVIKDGERYRAMSEPATTDYLNSIADGQDHIVKNVPNKTLEQFPIAGEILPKVEFKRDK